MSREACTEEHHCKKLAGGGCFEIHSGDLLTGQVHSTAIHFVPLQARAHMTWAETGG